MKTLILGVGGQLGKALCIEFPDAEQAGRNTLDVSSSSILTARNWQEYDLILNAAAYTAVDAAETQEGRVSAWKSNATALSYLSQISRKHDVTVVHISSDYVFDGTQAVHDEDEAFSPLGVYGQSKAAGDIAIRTAPRHYIVRTSWVIGEGKNFIETMRMLAEKGVKPSVVNDQIGRLTFTNDLAKGIKHLIENNSPFGTYNLTNDGESVSWADIAALVYEQVGHDRNEVTGVSTEEYYAGKDGIAPRPLQSTLELAKIKATGFESRDWAVALHEYLEQQS